jgi:hypothetical protein
MCVCVCVCVCVRACGVRACVCVFVHASLICSAPNANMAHPHYNFVWDQITSTWVDAVKPPGAAGAPGTARIHVKRKPTTNK